MQTMAAVDLHAPHHRVVSYAEGVRSRLNREAESSGWTHHPIPRGGLLAAITGGPLEASLMKLPSEHGRQPRSTCSVCKRWAPVTLTWRHHLEVDCKLDLTTDLVVACRRCSARGSM